MGTALTGLEIKDTYDGLVKTTDNGPLSGTAKYLSDGLGNDSALALSTTAVGIGLNLPIIKLEVQSSDVTVSRFISTNAANTGEIAITSAGGVGNNTRGRIVGGFDAGGSAFGGFLAFNTTTTQNVNNERMRITEAGNVGIGTDAPANKLTVVGTGSFDGAMVVRSTGTNTPQAVLGVDAVASAVGYVGTVNNIPFQIRTNDVTRLRVDADGLKFGSDTAAANALDDYEEGDITFGITFGGGSSGITYARNTGKYTKVGRQVTITGTIELTSKGTDTGNALITGLPFAVPNSIPHFATVALSNVRFITFADQIQAYVLINTSTVILNETTNAGVYTQLTETDFANNSEFVINCSYFV
jgi:hypothetical protein